VGSLNVRLKRLEGRIPPPENPGAPNRRALIDAILEEFGRLRSLEAYTHWHQDGRLVPIPPENKPAYYLGEDYTRKQLMELAIRRVWEREGLPEDHMESCMKAFERLGEPAEDLSE
jgi:hypothetical protein